MKASDIKVIISKCYEIPENKEACSGQSIGLEAWAKARRAIDLSIFKAGYDKAVKFTHAQFDANIPDIMEGSRQLGIKEVVEWINEHNQAGLKSTIYFLNNEWQSKLKEWGF